MTSGTMRGVRRSLWLLAAGTLSGAGAGAAFAQSPAYPAGAVVQALPTGDGGAELRRHLTDLASNPRSLASLLGAGRAALDIGDPQAALGFLARAEEIAPRDARVKAAMAAAFVQLEQPQAALRFFSEAQSLGAPEIEIAGDRGLAFDMTGNPRRAQQDYALVLQQRGDDAEIRRRLALSLAISGNRDAALRALDPLLQRRDRPSFRTRAFILALTGDATGASQAVQSAMPGQAADMAPFLARLAALNPAQKAMAVHFGRFPADGRAVRMAEAVDTSAHPAAVAMTGGGRPDANPSSFGRAVQRQQQPNRTAAAQQPARTAAAQPSRARPARALPQRPAQAAPATLEPRRRPGTEEPERSGRVGPGSRESGYRPFDIAGGEGVRPAPPAATEQRPAEQRPAPAVAAPARTVAQAPVRPPVQAPVRTVQASATPPAATAPQPGYTIAPPPAAAPAQQQPVRIAEVVPVDLPPSIIAEPAPAAEAPAAPAPAEAAPVSTGLADIAALVQSLPPEVERAAPAATPARAAPATATPRPATPRPAATTPARTASATPARTTAAQRPARAQPAPPAHPSRHWVQIAGGNRAAFNHQLGRLRASAPELLRGRTAYWAVNGNSNRLLVGPFATPAEARAFVNQLARKDVASFPWTSEAGEEVERLPAR